MISDFIFKVVLPSFLGSGTAFVTIKFLGKAIISHSLNKDIEKFKIELQEKTEYLKTSLAIYSNEKEISYHRIDSQRANAIHSIYQCICEISFSLIKLSQGPAIKDIPFEKHIEFFTKANDELSKIGNDMGETIRRNAIYFNNETYILIHNYFILSTQAYSDFMQIFTTGDFNKITTELLDTQRKQLEILLNNKIRPTH